MDHYRFARRALQAAATGGMLLAAAPASAEISATATVANVYLWRGLNLGVDPLTGHSSPQVAGSLNYTHESGLFAGAWGSSAGPWDEVDLYGGWSGSYDPLQLKATYFKYTYPNTPGVGIDEIGLSASVSDLFVDLYIGVGKTGPGTARVDNKNNYIDIGYTWNKVTAMLGQTDNDAPNTDYTHLDLKYAYNDRLSFTLSGILQSDEFAVTDGNRDPLFVVSYTLPLDVVEKKK